MSLPHDILVDEYPEVTVRYCRQVVRAISGGSPVGTLADLDDLAQETAMRFAKYAGTKQIHAPKQVLRQIARHVFSEQIRAKERHQRLLDRMSNIRQEVSEIPFIQTIAGPSPIKEEFLRRAKDRMSREDRRLFDITYSDEELSMAEQAERLGKELRAHTIQKNRFLSKLRSVKTQMATELLEVIRADQVLSRPRLDLYGALTELASNELEIADFRVLLLDYCSYKYFKVQFVSTPGPDGCCTPEVADVARSFHNETVRQFDQIPLSSSQIKDALFQGLFFRAVSRHTASHGLHEDKIADMFITGHLFATSLFRAYGHLPDADATLLECELFLHRFGHEPKISSLPERLAAIRPFDTPPLSREPHGCGVHV